MAPRGGALDLLKVLRSSISTLTVLCSFFSETWDCNLGAVAVS